MRALWFGGESITYRTDVPEPELSGDEMLIRVLKSGICSTDIEIGKGYMGFRGVPGHEFVGKVIDGCERGMIGQRVVGEINVPCGTCEYCVSGGDPRHCPDREVLGIFKRNGAFAEYVCLPPDNVYVLPESVSNEAALFVEPLAAAMRIHEQIQVNPADPVIVVGDGKLGLLIVSVLVLGGKEVILVGHHPERKSLPFLHGVTWVDETEAALLNKVPLVIEASGNSRGLELALGLVRSCGTLVLKSTVTKPVMESINELVINEITLMGSRCGRFSPAINLLASKFIDPRGLIQAEYPLERGIEAMHAAVQPGALKIVLQVDTSHE